jgi:APA family basic amino acid/polyamine antiporter
MMVSLPWETWVRLAVWLALGLAIYFGYGQKHSKLRQAAEGPASLESNP